MSNLSSWELVGAPEAKILVLSGQYVMGVATGSPHVVIAGDDHGELIGLAHKIENARQEIIQERVERARHGQ